MPVFFQVKPAHSEKKNAAGMATKGCRNLEMKGPEGFLELWPHPFLRPLMPVFM